MLFLLSVLCCYIQLGSGQGFAVGAGQVVKRPVDVMNSPTASSIFLCVSVSCSSRVKNISIDGFVIPINLLVLFCNISRCLSYLNF